MAGFSNGILVATDGSGGANLAARAAVDLSARTGAGLHVVHVWQEAWPGDPFAGAHSPLTLENVARERRAEEVLRDEVERLRDGGASVAGAHLRKGRPAEEIAGLAEDLNVDLVVVGSRGLGRVRRLAMGSVSEGVVGLARRPVLVMRGDEATWPPARVVVGADLSEEAREAAGVAMELGIALGAEILLVLAYERRLVTSLGTRDPRPGMEARRASNRARGALSRFSAGIEAEYGKRSKTRAVLGDAAAVLQGVAEEGGTPTLVAVGSRGLNAVRRAVLGSVSAAVLRSVGCPVLVAPSEQGGRDGAP